MIHWLKQLSSRREHNSVLNRWRNAAGSAETMELGELRQLRNQARALEAQVERIARIADNRLLVPRLGSNRIDAPADADWQYRPETWRLPIEPHGKALVPTAYSLGAATLHHDASSSAVAFRQIRNRNGVTMAPLGLRLETFAFEGTFLSLAIDLPEDAVVGLKRNHIIRMNAHVEIERALDAYARLNIKQGPNVEPILQKMPLGSPELSVEFDLEHSKISENRLERMWLDLIFEKPVMNAIFVRDVTLSRRPRAEF